MQIFKYNRLSTILVTFWNSSEPSAELLEKDSQRDVLRFSSPRILQEKIGREVRFLNVMTFHVHTR